jgi:hypothetical protein
MDLCAGGFIVPHEIHLALALMWKSMLPKQLGTLVVRPRTVEASISLVVDFP